MGPSACDSCDGRGDTDLVRGGRGGRGGQAQVDMSRRVLTAVGGGARSARA